MPLLSLLSAVYGLPAPGEVGLGSQKLRQAVVAGRSPFSASISSRRNKTNGLMSSRTPYRPRCSQTASTPKCVIAITTSMRHSRERCAARHPAMRYPDSSAAVWCACRGCPRRERHPAFGRLGSDGVDGCPHLLLFKLAVYYCFASLFFHKLLIFIGFWKISFGV